MSLYKSVQAAFNAVALEDNDPKHSVLRDVLVGATIGAEAPTDEAIEASLRRELRRVREVRKGLEELDPPAPEAVERLTAQEAALRELLPAAEQ